MIERIKEELDTAQTRLRDASDRLGGQGADWVRTARHQVHLARGESQERLWKLEHRALDLADDVLGRADDVPGAGKVAEPLEKLVEQRRAQSLAVPVEAYDALNARAAAAAVRELGPVDLLKIERYETDNKSRKTVFEAVTRRRTELSRPPFVD